MSDATAPPLGAAVAPAPAHERRGLRALLGLPSGPSGPPLALRLPDLALEERYRHDRYVEFLPMQRLSMLLGFLLYAGFGLCDMFVVPDVLELAWTIRYLVVCPLLLLALAASFGRDFERHHQWLLAIAVGAAGFGICLMMALARPPGNHLYYVGVIIVVIYAFHFVQLRFRVAAGLAWSMFAVYALQVAVLNPVPVQILINNLSLFATATLVATVTGYMHEAFVRSAYLGRRQMEEAQRRFANVVANVPGAVFRYQVRADGQISIPYVSRALEDIFGRSPETLMANPGLWYEWLHPDDREGLAHAMAVARDRRVQGPDDGTQRFAHELRFVGSDGTVRWMRILARPHALDSGEVAWDGIYLDITDRKEREAELLQARKMEAVGQLTGGIAHDFNNLLTVVGGNLQLLSEDLPPGSEQLEMASEARGAVERGRGLTQRLLAFSRRQALAPRPLDLAELVERMSGLLRRSLGGAVRIRTAIPAGLPAVLLDPAQLESAVLNLAINARDAMPEGGELRLQAVFVRLDADYCARHPDAVPGDYVELRVTDDGLGMTADVRERVFEPFFTTKEAGKGSGLGLSMVYGFVRQSNGHIRIDSAPGRGTEVRLYLPLAPAGPAPAAPAATEGPAPTGAGELVLLAEDDPAVRRLAARMLADLGYRVREAASGEDALGGLDDAVDLLLTDIVMPGGMSGIALAAAARERRPGLRIVYTTGYAEQLTAQDAPQAQRTLLIRKPYAKEELGARLRQAFEEA